jgi:hypothetical protein
MLFREIVAVYCENRMEHIINTRCVGKVQNYAMFARVGGTPYFKMLIMWLKTGYGIHISLQYSQKPHTEPYITQTHQTHTATSLFKFHWSTIIPLCLGLPSAVFPLDTPTKIWCYFLMFYARILWATRLLISGTVCVWKVRTERLGCEIFVSLLTRYCACSRQNINNLEVTLF